MKGIPQKLVPWVEARSRFKLTHAEVQMARELGMNPKKLGKLSNTRQEPWKVPLKEFIAECYRKQFGRNQPERVRSIEDIVRDEKKRNEERKARKAARQAAEAQPQPTSANDHCSAAGDVAPGNAAQDLHQLPPPECVNDVAGVASTLRLRALV